METDVNITIHFSMEPGESLEDAINRLQNNLKSIGIECDELVASESYNEKE